MSERPAPTRKDFEAALGRLEEAADYGTAPTEDPGLDADMVWRYVAALEKRSRQRAEEAA